MNLLYTLLYVFAAVCFAVAVYESRPRSQPSHVRIDLVALGLLLWVLVPTIQHIQAYTN